MEQIKTIKTNGIAEVIEKKSKFIGQAFYVETKQQAEEIIKKVKTEYSDAKHNCYAYSILEDGSTITKSSDDGEPSGTAGIPILNVIKEKNLTNVLIIVTRYFGGILLGTGGLVRAYTKTAVDSIEKSEIIKKELGHVIRFKTDYNKLEQLKYYLNQNNCKICKITYLEKIELIAEITEKIKKELEENERKKHEMFETMETLKITYIQQN